MFNITGLEEVNYEKEAENLLEKMEITYDAVENYLELNKSETERGAKRQKKE